METRLLDALIGIILFVIVIGVVIGFLTDSNTGIFAKLDTAKTNIENDTDVGSYAGSFSLIGKLLLLIAIFVAPGYAVYRKLTEWLS